MEYGHFDDEAREYVITNPVTPRPWINYYLVHMLHYTTAVRCYASVTSVYWELGSL